MVVTTDPQSFTEASRRVKINITHLDEVICSKIPLESKEFEYTNMISGPSQRQKRHQIQACPMKFVFLLSPLEQSKIRYNKDLQALGRRETGVRGPFMVSGQFQEIPG